MRKFRSGLWIVLAIVLLGLAAFAIPQVRNKAFALFEEWRVQVRAALFPVQDQAFVPGGERLATVTPDFPTSTVTPIPASATPTITPLTPQPTATQTASPTPLPGSVSL